VTQPASPQLDWTGLDRRAVDTVRVLAMDAVEEVGNGHPGTAIGLGEDGPTHQPIEQLAALRAIPGLDVVRPADANETAVAWRTILEHPDRPAGLALTRQNLPVFPRGTEGFASAEQTSRGAYVLLDAPGGAPDVLLIATGSEVQYAVEARSKLAEQDIAARVISMPCREFDEQDDAYRESVIPPDICARVSIEAGVGQCWRGVVGDAGEIICIEHYGASAAGALLFEKFGFTADAVVAAARTTLTAAQKAPSVPLRRVAHGPVGPAGTG
jgi:transketolase